MLTKYSRRTFGATVTRGLRCIVHNKSSNTSGQSQGFESDNPLLYLLIFRFTSIAIKFQMNDSAQKEVSPNAFVSKLPFVWLALIAGFFGAHWIYTGNYKRAFILVLFMPLSAFAGWIDCMRFGLMPDEEFNRRMNPGHNPETKQTNGLVVTAVVLALGVSVTALMSLLAVVFQLIIEGTVA